MLQLTEAGGRGYRHVYVSDNVTFVETRSPIPLNSLRMILTDSHFLVPCCVLVAGFILLITLK
jgi:hypothetical protein